MIEFCDGAFTAERDKYQWILTEWYDGKDKHGNHKRQSRETYHASLAQVCSVVIDRMAGHCESMEGLRELLGNATALLTNAAESCAA